MIRMNNWVIVCPSTYTCVGYDGEHKVRRFEIAVDDPLWIFALDVKCEETGKIFSIPMTVSENVVGFDITENLHFAKGKYTGQIVGAKPDGAVKKSNKFVFYVAESINAYETIIPSEGEGNLFVTIPPTGKIGQTLVITDVDDEGRPITWEAVDFPENSGNDSVFIVEATPDENWNPVLSHTREEVLVAISERKFVVLRISGYELALDPYPEFGEILPDDAELRFSAETGGSTLYLYWTAEGIFFSEDNWVSRYTGLPEGNHSKNGTSHLIESVRQDVYGICYFAFRAFGDYRTGDTFTIQFYDGGDSEPYDVKVTPKLWNTEDLPDKYFTNGAIVTCAFKDGTVPTLYFMGGTDGKPGKDGNTPVKGTDYFTEADKAEMVSAVISALPVYDGEFVEVMPT